MCGDAVWGCEDLYTCHNSTDSGGYCDIPGIKANSSQWETFGFPIDYCLAQKVEPRCKLQLSRDILVAVIICNLLKAAAMIATLLLQQEPALVTTGDAISSWLKYPDEITANQCLRNARTNGHNTSPRLQPAHDAGSHDF